MFWRCPVFKGCQVSVANLANIMSVKRQFSGAEGNDFDLKTDLFIIKCTIMNVIKRVNAPTPKFFRVLRTIGLILTAVGGSLLAAPVALPVAVLTAGGYLTVAGGVMTAVSQLTIAEEEDDLQ